jgi:hypothetical protein
MSSRRARRIVGYNIREREYGIDPNDAASRWLAAHEAAAAEDGAPGTSPTSEDRGESVGKGTPNRARRSRPGRALVTGARFRGLAPADCPSHFFATIIAGNRSRAVCVYCWKRQERNERETGEKR